MILSSFLLCASQLMLTLLSLALLENPEWEADLLQLQASLDVPGAVAAAGLRSWGQLLELGPEDPRLGHAQGADGGIWRGGHWVPYPMGTLHYQEGEEEGEGGRKRNEAITSIIGGLQAFNREKGGFGVPKKG
uniref:Uncharacterized protein n=1 Tax=Oncorhynchus mykiss TaxID=8022 RepID=A0A8C7QCC2_ONCMY